MTRLKCIDTGKGKAFMVVIADTYEELITHKVKIPYATGSIAMIINTDQVFMLNSSGEWKEQTHISIAL